MKTHLKQGLIIILTMVSSSILLSFSNKEKNSDKRFGGTASATVEVDFALVDSATKFVLQSRGIKEGSRRVVEVSTPCSHDSKSDAQADLQKEISYQKKNYEKTVSGINYNISDCD